MAHKCGKCGGVTVATPVDTSQFPVGSLQPVADACRCGRPPASGNVPLTSCPPKCAPACSPCAPKSCSPKKCVSACEEDHTNNVYINNFSTTVKTTSAFNFPNVGGTAEFTLANVTSLIPGQILWASNVGRLHVNSYDPQTRKVVVTNTGDSCDAGALSPGELVPACTELAVSIPECNEGNGNTITAGPFLAADMVAPGNGNCTTIKVTTILGLGINDIVSIASFLYRISEIIDTETIVVCDDGDGAPLGQVIEWDPNCDEIPDVPVLPISGDNPCSKAPISEGLIVVCDDTGQQTTLGGSVTGQIPVWDEDIEKFKLVAANLGDVCTFISACCFVVDIGDDGPYLVTVADSSIFTVGDQVKIDGDVFTVDSIEDATHIRLIPAVTPVAIKEYDIGTLVCIRDCCEFLPEIINNPCYPNGRVFLFNTPAETINIQIGPTGNVTPDMTGDFYLNPISPLPIAEYTNETACRQIFELELEVAQSVLIGDNAPGQNTRVYSEVMLARVADITSVLPRVTSYFDSVAIGSGNPPSGFIQANTSSAWQILNWDSGYMKRRLILDPGESTDFRLHHRMIIKQGGFTGGGAAVSPPTAAVDFYGFVHGYWTVYNYS